MAVRKQDCKISTEIIGLSEEDDKSNIGVFNHLTPRKEKFTLTPELFSSDKEINFAGPIILDKNVKKNVRCMSNFRILPSKARSLKILPPCAVAVQNILDSLPVCEYSLSFGQNVADLILKLLHQHSGSTTFYLRFHSVPNNSTKEKFTYMLSTK